MEKLVGYYWFGKENEVPIIKKEDGKYYLFDNSQYEEFEKEKLQYAMTTPWSGMWSNIEQPKTVGGEFEVSYISNIYDSISCRIVGRGKRVQDAIVNMVENVLELFQGYNKEQVEKFMDNCN